MISDQDAISGCVSGHASAIADGSFGFAQDDDVGVAGERGLVIGNQWSVIRAQLANESVGMLPL